MKIFNFIVNLMFPKNIKCIICDKELSKNTHYALCESCFNGLPKNNKKTCQKCGQPILNTSATHCLACKTDPPKFTQSFSPLLYKAPVTNLIKQFKYDNKKYLAETLGNFLVQEYIERNLNCDIVVPVPLHEKRLKQRGFNQAELLANQLNVKLNIEVNSNILTRVKNTKTQTVLSKEERQDNVSDAFKVLDKQTVKNKVVLLIDDVYTTGSTLNECAKVLFKAGAKKVYAITLSHTMPQKDFIKMQ